MRNYETGNSCRWKTKKRRILVLQHTITFNHDSLTYKNTNINPNNKKKNSLELKKRGGNYKFDQGKEISKES